MSLSSVHFDQILFAQVIGDRLFITLKDGKILDCEKTEEITQ